MADTRDTLRATMERVTRCSPCFGVYLGPAPVPRRAVRNLCIKCVAKLASNPRSIEATNG